MLAVAQKVRKIADVSKWSLIEASTPVVGRWTEVRKTAEAVGAAGKTGLINGVVVGLRGLI